MEVESPIDEQKRPSKMAIGKARRFCTPSGKNKEFFNLNYSVSKSGVLCYLSNFCYLEGNHYLFNFCYLAISFFLHRERILDLQLRYQSMLNTMDGIADQTGSDPKFF